ncbi:MAG: hypothetical protein FWG32_01185 [Oscillospiraceae bacterium]|nr:hypothetical protein [Oscillospiraceae bacterium]
MERTDKITKITMFILFAAMLAYIGASLFRSITDSVRTAPAILITEIDGAFVSGIIIRDEYVIISNEEYVSVSAEDGKMVAAGAPVAVSMSSSAAFERENRIRTLELEIERLNILLSGITTPEDLAARDAAVREAVLALSRSTSVRDMADTDSISLKLSSLLFESSASNVTEADVAALERELTAIRNSSAGRSAVISAEKAGLFMSALDGYEHLTPEFPDDLSVSGLRAVQQSRQEPPDGAVGKIIHSFTWYFAAATDEDRAAALKEGATVTLDFGRYYNLPLKVRVVKVSPPENGECVAVFSGSAALADTAALREVTARIIFNEYTGIRVPIQAVRMDQNGQPYVYTVTAMQAERKNIDIIRTYDDYCIAAQSTGAGSLRVGNEIIISAKNITEGKLIG